MLRGAIVDVDGTLIDSNDAHAESWTRTFAAHGYDVGFDDVREQIGKGGDRLLHELAGVDDDSDEGQAMKDERRALFLKEYLRQLRPIAGGRELLLRLREHGVKLVVGTSADEKELAKLLRQAGVDDLFDARTTSSEVQFSKPAPDIVVRALQKLSLPKDDVVMIGDTPYDVTAAKRAGVRAIALRTGGWDDDDLADAVAIYDSPVEVVRALDRPPFSLASAERRAW
jgi:HAD superfamily hydrolase (TIGR01509 family)